MDKPALRPIQGRREGTHEYGEALEAEVQVYWL